MSRVRVGCPHEIVKAVYESHEDVRPFKDNDAFRCVACGERFVVRKVS